MQTKYLLQYVKQKNNEGLSKATRHMNTHVAVLHNFFFKVLEFKMKKRFQSKIPYLSCEEIVIGFLE